MFARQQQTGDRSQGPAASSSSDRSQRQSQKHKLLPHRQHSPPRLHLEVRSAGPGQALASCNFPCCKMSTRSCRKHVHLTLTLSLTMTITLPGSIDSLPPVHIAAAFATDISCSTLCAQPHYLSPF